MLKKEKRVGRNRKENRKRKKKLAEKERRKRVGSEIDFRTENREWGKNKRVVTEKKGERELGVKWILEPREIRSS